MADNTDNLECKIIYYLLIEKKSRKEKDNHNLRKYLQKIVIEDFDGDLISFFDHLYDNSEAVAYFAYETFTLDFIAKLMNLIKETAQITNTRAKLHEWMYIQTGEASYLERANNIIIDAKINKVRNVLDNSSLGI